MGRPQGPVSRAIAATWPVLSAFLASDLRRESGAHRQLASGFAPGRAADLPYELGAAAARLGLRRSPARRVEQRGRAASRQGVGTYRSPAPAGSVPRSRRIGPPRGPDRTSDRPSSILPAARSVPRGTTVSAALGNGRSPAPRRSVSRGTHFLEPRWDELEGRLGRDGCSAHGRTCVRAATVILRARGGSGGCTRTRPARFARRTFRRSRCRGGARSGRGSAG